jgi:hypothetical protein
MSQNEHDFEGDLESDPDFFGSPFLPDAADFAVDGQCRICGCTELEPCPGGCIWANSDATLCSRCARDGS